MRYAIWYDNTSGVLEAFKVIEAQNPEDAISKSLEEGLSSSLHIVVTLATATINGFGNDPNIANCVVAGSNNR
jgi:hypothetical protein